LVSSFRKVKTTKRTSPLRSIRSEHCCKGLRRFHSSALLPWCQDFKFDPLSHLQVFLTRRFFLGNTVHEYGSNAQHLLSENRDLVGLVVEESHIEVVHLACVLSCLFSWIETVRHFLPPKRSYSRQRIPVFYCTDELLGPLSSIFDLPVIKPMSKKMHPTRSLCR